MKKILIKNAIKRKKDYIYYIDDKGNLFEYNFLNKKEVPILLTKSIVKRKHGCIYSIDGKGNLIESSPIVSTKNQSISLDTYKEEDYIVREATIKEGKNSFCGQYNSSKNKEFVIAYGESEDNDDDLTKKVGRVYLIKNNGILWKKKIYRPRLALVTNKGRVILFEDSACSENGLGCRMHIIDETGKNISAWDFIANIRDNELLLKNNELILQTYAPENAAYLFNIDNLTLIKKIKYLPRRNFSEKKTFEEFKKEILDMQVFDQRGFDEGKDKQKNEYKIREEQLKLLKTKQVEKLSYNDLVWVGSIYSGDFYSDFGEPKKALNYILKAIELRVDNPQPYVLKLAGFCYEKLKDYVNAIKYYEYAIKRFPTYRTGIVGDHLEFCKLKLNKKTKEDWTSFIVNKKEC